MCLRPAKARNPKRGTGGERTVAAFDGGCGDHRNPLRTFTVRSPTTSALGLSDVSGFLEGEQLTSEHVGELLALRPR